MRSSDMGWIRTNLDFPILWAFPESLFRAGGVLASFSVFQFFSFAYGTIPEHFRRQNWKTEKLFFYGESLPGSLWKKNSFSVFQFCLRNSSGTFPETKLKNWKTEKLFFYGESLPGSLWKKQFFSFSVLLTELFRNISGDKTKKLKNWKTVFLWRISPWMSLEKTVFQFFSFAYGTLPEHFRRLKNWKTEKLFFLWRISPWMSLEKKQFFSFSVLLTEVFRNIPHFLVVQCMSYIFIYELDMWPPKRSLPNLEVKMCLKHCKNQCFFEKCRFLGGGHHIYIYICIFWSSCFISCHQSQG